MREFYVCFTDGGFVPMLVLQLWFCNKLGFIAFGDFPKLGDEGVCFWPFNLERNMTNL